MTTQFIQKTKVGVEGSLINQLMGNNSSIPEVGKGATIMHYTDRSCYEVVEVSTDSKRVKLEALNAIGDVTKDLGIGHQNWLFEPTGRFSTLVWYRGAWCTEGEGIEFTKEFIAEANEAGFSCIGAYTYKCKPELHKEIYGNAIYPCKVIPGVTRSRKYYSKVNVMFGVKSYYYDWSF